MSMPVASTVPAQAPFTHAPLGHTLPQAPQLSGSNHKFGEFIVQTHCPPTHVSAGWQSAFQVQAGSPPLPPAPPLDDVVLAPPAPPAPLELVLATVSPELVVVPAAVEPPLPLM